MGSLHLHQVGKMNIVGHQVQVHASRVLVFITVLAFTLAIIYFEYFFPTDDEFWSLRTDVLRLEQTQKRLEKDIASSRRNIAQLVRAERNMLPNQDPLTQVTINTITSKLHSVNASLGKFRQVLPIDAAQNFRLLQAVC